MEQEGSPARSAGYKSAFQEGLASSISELAERLERPVASVSHGIRALHTYELVGLKKKRRLKTSVLVSTHIIIPLG